jgi:hypothetical protein
MSKPHSPKIPKAKEVKTVIEEEPEDVKRRARQALPKGREENILAGIAAVLKKRLGE